MTEKDKNSNDAYSNDINRSKVEELLREADRELDAAVEVGGYEGQAKYWLGRKRALKDVLRERTQDTGKQQEEEQ